jgi:hypothetical protein
MSTRRQELQQHFNSYIETGIPSLKRQGYSPTGYMQIVEARGSHYRAAIFLLNSSVHTHYGFQRLHAMRRLDASVEYAASLPWFQELFTDEQLYEARTRLITHEFDLDRALAKATANPPAWLDDLEGD